MSVTREEVAKIASLARIKMGEDELERMVPELNGILAWVEQLGEVDCSGVEPMTAVIPNTLRLREQMLRYMGKRGELEKFIKAAMDDVARKRAEAERMSVRAAARKERVVIERDLHGHRKLRSVRVEDMTEKERQDAVDVLLAEQRVIRTLYEKSFKSFDGDKADDVVRDDLGGISLAAAIKEDRNLVQSMWSHFPISYVSDDDDDKRVRRRLRRRRRGRPHQAAPPQRAWGCCTRAARSSADNPFSASARSALKVSQIL